MGDCPRLGRWIGGCKFSPRYDTVSATEPDVFALLMANGTPLKATPARKTYLCDVCETCGKTLFRRKTDPTRATTGRTLGPGMSNDPTPHSNGEGET